MQEEKTLDTRTNNYYYPYLVAKEQKKLYLAPIVLNSRLQIVPGDHRVNSTPSSWCYTHTTNVIEPGRSPAINICFQKGNSSITTIMHSIANNHLISSKNIPFAFPHPMKCTRGTIQIATFCMHINKSNRNINSIHKPSKGSTSMQENHIFNAPTRTQDESKPTSVKSNLIPSYNFNASR